MQEALKLLGELRDEDLKWLLETGNETTVEAATDIIAEETDPEHLYIVLSGLVAIRVAALGEAPLAHLGPGELLGEISFLEGSPASATAAAAERTTLLAIPRVDLAARLESDTAFAARVYKALALLGERRLRERVGALGARRATLPDMSADALGEMAPLLIGTMDEFKELLLRAGEEGKDAASDPFSTHAPKARELFARMLQPLNELIGDGGPGGPDWRGAMGRRVQKDFLPYVLLSRFAERCFNKPRGYAGDYLTIEWMYNNETAGQGPVGKLVDAAILDAQPCRAVRNRRGMLAAAVRETLERKGDGRARVASFACGPAAEVFDVLAEMDDPARLEVSLVDIDWEALGYVSARLEKENRARQVKLHHANLVYLATGRETLPLEDLDLVYSIGLIDYFEDKFVVALLDYAHSVLAEGGRVILGNFHPRNAGKAFMDHVLDWKLIHRTEDDMNRIFAASRFGRPCTRIDYEAERVNLFAECLKG